MYRRHLVLALVVAVAISGCSSNPSRPPGSITGFEPVGARVVDTAIALIGTPYRYGGSTPAGFDCSGLVHYAYGMHGVSVPRTTGQLLRGSDAIALRDARAGDLIFFDITSKADHVGIFVGDGRFVHAPSSGKHVSMASLDDPFWRSSFVGARRLD